MRARKVPHLPERSTACRIPRITEVTELRDFRRVFLRQLSAQGDYSKRRRRRGRRQPKINSLRPVRNKSLHKGTIQKIWLGAMIWWRCTAQPLTPSPTGPWRCHFGMADGRASPRAGPFSCPSLRSLVSYALYNSVCYLGSWLCLSHKSLDRRRKDFHHSASDPVAFEFPWPLPRPPGALRPSSSLMLPRLLISVPSSWRPRRTSRGFSPSTLSPQRLDGLPSGPLQSQHRTLEMGLADLGGRADPADLGLCRAALHLRRPRPGRGRMTRVPGMPCRLPIWRSCARPDPPDWRMRPGGTGTAIFPGRTGARADPRRSIVIEPRLKAWAEAGGKSLRPFREERIELTFGFASGSWTDERVLERYELLFEAGLVPEACATRSRLPLEGAARARSADGPRPPAHPGHRHRPPARQDQVPAGDLRADARLLHAAGTPEDGRGSVRGAPAQAELPPPGGDARAWWRKPARSPPKLAGALPGSCASGARCWSSGRRPACDCPA